MTRLHFVLRPFSQTGPCRQRITVGLCIPDNFRDRCSRGKMRGRIELVECWREERHGWISAMGQNLGFISGRNSSGSLLMDIILLLEWFMVYCKHSKWEAVLMFWERYHSSTDTWPRGGTEYHPHRYCSVHLTHAI